MAQHFIKASLSASINGQPVRITATSTPATTIHTATSSSTLDSIDEVWIWAGNTTTSAINLTVNVGASGSELSKIHTRVPAAFNGPIPVLPGIPCMGSLVISATASAEGVNVFGFINRIGGQTTS